MKFLDRLLAVLGDVDTDRRLANLEASVWAEIDAADALRLPPLSPPVAATLYVAVALFAYVAGAAAGGEIKRTTLDPLLLSPSHLPAPSALFGK